MSNRQELEQAVEAAVEQYNEDAEGFTDPGIEMDFGGHFDGPAIDLRKRDGGAVTHGLFGVYEAVHDSGYRVSNIKVLDNRDDPKTRVFLREVDQGADVRINTERDGLLKRVLSGPDSMIFVRGDDRVSIAAEGDIDYTDAEIYRRLDREGAFDKPRAEGFLVGLLVASTVSMDDLYPRTYDVDLDAGEMAREVAGTETAEDAVEWVHDEYGEGYAHVSELGPDDANPFVLRAALDEGTPPGWKQSEEAEYGDYLLKE